MADLRQHVDLGTLKTVGLKPAVRKQIKSACSKVQPEPAPATAPAPAPAPEPLNRVRKYCSGVQVVEELDDILIDSADRMVIDSRPAERS